jgi:hypothetical protein
VSKCIERIDRKWIAHSDLQISRDLWNAIISTQQKLLMTLFFLEHIRELRIIILRRNGFEPVQPPPKYKLKIIDGTIGYTILT